MKKERMYQVAFFVGIFALWEFTVRVFGIADFLLPGPLAIMAEIGKNYPRLLYHLQQTVLEVVVGFGLGVSAGIILSIIAVHFWFCEITIYPLVAALQTIPKITIAPLLLIWLGFGIWSKIVISGFMSFFPIIINLTKGLKNIDPDLQDWLGVYRANKREVLWHIRIFNALPDFFSGLKIAVPLGIIGAIVGEFVGAQRGLGYLILQAQASFNIALMFASIIALSLIGIVLFGLVKFAEKWVRWLTKVNNAKMLW